MTPAEDFCSIWQWLSIAPGSTSLPEASISRAPAGRPRPSAAVRPPLIPMSHSVVSAAVATVPLRMTRSYSGIPVPFDSSAARLRRRAGDDKKADGVYNATVSRVRMVMSAQTRAKRLSVTQIQRRKGGDKLVCLTAYTASMARHLDEEVDLLLVGDSLGMTVYGFDSTLPVTLEMMIAHGAAVVRATHHVHITVDLPFGSYQALPEQAFRAAARV